MLESSNAITLNGATLVPGAAVECGTCWRTVNLGELQIVGGFASD